MNGTTRNGGIGMTSARTRERLIERLKAEGIRNPAVLERVRAVPRHLFVDEALASRAYEDTALPIGFGQTISQPYIVAAMTEALIEGGKKLTRVLEIGTGCGYQTAVLAPFVQHVYSVERIAPLLQRARSMLAELRITNVSLRHADGWHGWRSQAPFQGILVAAAPEMVPPELYEQLDDGGRLVIPIGARGRQTLLRVTRNGEEFEREELLPVSFVPFSRARKREREPQEPPQAAPRPQIAPASCGTRAIHGGRRRSGSARRGCCCCRLHGHEHQRARRPARSARRRARRAARRDAEQDRLAASRRPARARDLERHHGSGLAARRAAAAARAAARLRRRAAGARRRAPSPRRRASRRRPARRRRLRCSRCDHAPPARPSPTAAPPRRSAPTAAPAPPPRWAWPTDGRIVTGFGSDDGIASGIGIGGRDGQPVRAAAAGRVVYAGGGLIGYGQLVIIKHDETFLSAYGYNADLLVTQGQDVARGATIARMGQGPGRQPRLHFEIRRNGVPVDPLLFVTAPR